MWKCVLCTCERSKLIDVSFLSPFIISCVCGHLGASALDPEMCGRYKLSVMVKDMAGKANAFFSTGIVTVEVTGNTWASPDPVRLQENLPGPYPIPISQVRIKASSLKYRKASSLVSG